MPVLGPSIVTIDNNSNWEDALTTNSAANLISNRPNSSTCSWSKLYCSDNTNEQLANILRQLANTLIANLSRLLRVDFIFLSIVYFLFDLFLYFLFLEQIGLGLISHTVTI